MSIPIEDLVSVSLPVLEAIYNDSGLLAKHLQRADIYELLSLKYNVQVSSFPDLLQQKGELNLDQLLVQHAKNDNFEDFQEIAEKGASSWYEAALFASANSPQITAYLFELFTNMNKSLILAAYAARRYERIFKQQNISLMDYIIKYHQEPDSLQVLQAIAIGAASTDNVKLVERCLKYGVGNLEAIIIAAILTNASNVLTAFAGKLSKEVLLKLIKEYGNEHTSRILK